MNEFFLETRMNDGKPEIRWVDSVNENATMWRGCSTQSLPPDPVLIRRDGTSRFIVWDTKNNNCELWEVFGGMLCRRLTVGPEGLQVPKTCDELCKLIASL